MVQSKLFLMFSVKNVIGWLKADKDDDEIPHHELRVSCT
jgi:hypothetical protein